MDLEAILAALRSLWVIWLIIIFLGIVIWAFRPRNRARFEADAQIPLKDDDKGES